MARKDKPKDVEVQISSYLDGELTSAQTEKMEHLFAENDEARELLQDMKKVRQSLRNLPAMPAPEDLVEDVIQQFERDILLDRSDGPANFSSDKHVHTRRFAAAAAMILLTGSIGYLIFTVLQNPNSMMEPGGDSEYAMKSAENDMSDEAARNPERAITANRSQPQPPAVVSRSRFSTMNMDVTTAAMMGTIDDLEEFLRQHDIHNVIRNYPEADEFQYAFMCSSQAFEAFVQLMKTDKNQLTLRFPGREAAGDITLRNPSEQEILLLASEADPTRQMYLAINFSNSSQDIPEDLQKLALSEMNFKDLIPLGGSGVDSSSGNTSFKVDPDNENSSITVGQSVDSIAVMVAIKPRFQETPPAEKQDMPEDRPSLLDSL